MNVVDKTSSVFKYIGNLSINIVILQSIVLCFSKKFNMTAILTRMHTYNSFCYLNDLGRKILIQILKT